MVKIEEPYIEEGGIKNLSSIIVNHGELLERRFIQADLNICIEINYNNIAYSGFGEASGSNRFYRDDMVKEYEISNCERFSFRENPKLYEGCQVY